MHSTEAHGGSLDARSLRKIALASMAGTSVEYFDFFLFASAAATIFPKVFFTAASSPLVATIEAFAAFALGFVARPLGAMLFGHFGDVLGRKTMFVVAMTLMGLATACMGLLPGYAMIGDAAPLLLIALRLLQGIALGGQWGGAVLLILENAPAERQGWFCSFAQIGPPVGTILANIAFLICTLTLGTEAFQAWAWRLPFLASIALVGLGYWIHRRMEESDAFVAASRAKADAGPRRSPLFAALRESPVPILLAACTYMGMQASFYVLVSFVMSYAAQLPGAPLSTSDMLVAVLVGAVVMIPAVFWASALSDRIGPARIIFWGAIGTALWSLAIFPLLDSGRLAATILAMAVGQVLNGCVFGPIAPLFGQLFGVRTRYSGMSLAYQLGSMVGGGLAPILAVSLLHGLGSGIAIGVYLMSMSLVSALCARTLSKSGYQVALPANGPQPVGS